MKSTRSGDAQTKLDRFVKKAGRIHDAVMHISEFLAYVRNTDGSELDIERLKTIGEQLNEVAKFRDPDVQSYARSERMACQMEFVTKYGLDRIEDKKIPGFERTEESDRVWENEDQIGQTQQPYDLGDLHKELVALVKERNSKELYNNELVQRALNASKLSPSEFVEAVLAAIPILREYEPQAKVNVSRQSSMLFQPVKVEIMPIPDMLNISDLITCNRLKTDDPSAIIKIDEITLLVNDVKTKNFNLGKKPSVIPDAKASFAMTAAGKQKAEAARAEKQKEVDAKNDQNRNKRDAEQQCGARIKALKALRKLAAIRFPDPYYDSDPKKFMQAIKAWDAQRIEAVAYVNLIGKEFDDIAAALEQEKSALNPGNWENYWEEKMKLAVSELVAEYKEKIRDYYDERELDNIALEHIHKNQRMIFNRMQYNEMAECFNFIMGGKSLQYYISNLVTLSNETGKPKNSAVREIMEHAPLVYGACESMSEHTAWAEERAKVKQEQPFACEYAVALPHSLTVLSSNEEDLKVIRLLEKPLGDVFANNQDIADLRQLLSEDGVRKHIEKISKTTTKESVTDLIIILTKLCDPASKALDISKYTDKTLRSLYTAAMEASVEKQAAKKQSESNSVVSIFDRGDAGNVHTEKKALTGSKAVRDIISSGPDLHRLIEKAILMEDAYSNDMHTARSAGKLGNECAFPGAVVPHMPLLDRKGMSQSQH